MKLKSCVKRLQSALVRPPKSNDMCLDDSGAVKPITSHVPRGLLCCETNHMCLEDCCAVKQIACALRTVVLWNKSHVPWGLLCCETNHMCLEDCYAVKQITCALRTVVLWNKSHVPWGLLCCETNHMWLESCCAVKQIKCLKGICAVKQIKCLKGICAVKQITCALRAVVLWHKDPSWVPDCQLAEQCLEAISQLRPVHTASYLRVTCYVPLQASNTRKEEKIFPKCYFGNRSLQEYFYK